MEWKDVGDAIKKYLPEAQGILSVASLIPGVGAITGPAAMAITALSKALGTEATPDAVMQAIATDPNIALKMKQAELDFQLQMRDKDLAETKEQNEIIKARLNDVQSARAMHVDETKVTGKRDNEDKVFDWFIIVGFTVTLVALFYYKPPESTYMGMMIGAIIAAFTTIVNFRKGSSASGNEKTAMIYNSTPNLPKKDI